MTWKIPVLWCLLPCAALLHVVIWWYFMRWLGWPASDGLRVVALFCGFTSAGITTMILAERGHFKSGGKR